MIAVLLISFVLYSAFSQAGSPSIVNLISTAGNKDDGIKCVSHPPTGINYLDPSPWWLAEGRLNSLAEECYTNIGARCARIYDTKAFKHELLFNGIATHAGEWATSEMFIPPPNTYHDHLSDWATWLARNLRVIDICKIKCTCNDYTSLEYDETTILVAILDLSPDGLRVLPVPRHGGIRPIERDFASGYGAIAIPADVGLSRSESSSYGETLYWGATGSTSSEAFETGEVGLRAFQVVGQRQQSPYCDSVVIPDHVASAMVEVSATLGLEEPSERVWLPVPKFKSATQLCLHTVFGGHAEMNLGMVCSSGYDLAVPNVAYSRMSPLFATPHTVLYGGKKSTLYRIVNEFCELSCWCSKKDGKEPEGWEKLKDVATRKRKNAEDARAARRGKRRCKGASCSGPRMTGGGCGEGCGCRAFQRTKAVGPWNGDASFAGRCVDMYSMGSRVGTLLGTSGLG